MLKLNLSENSFMSAMWDISKKDENVHIIVDDTKYLILGSRAMYGNDIQLMVAGEGDVYKLFDCLVDLFPKYIEKKIAIISKM